MKRIFSTLLILLIAKFSSSTTFDHDGNISNYNGAILNHDGDTSNDNGAISNHDGEHEAQATGQVFVQGDMLLQPKQHRAAYQLNLDDPRSFAGAALESKRKRWRGGVIPYTIDAGLSGVNRRGFEWAAGVWNENTCIRILPKGSPGTEGILGSIKV